jgi:hypothetical protein
MEQIGNRSAVIADQVRAIVAAASTAAPNIVPAPGAVPGLPAGVPPAGVTRLDATSVLVNLTTTGVQLAVINLLFSSELIGILFCE